jgi:hypothetical protein
MPGVGSAPYATGAQILQLIQNLVSDPQGQLFSDSYCLQSINSGARYVARELRNRGKMTLIQDEYLVTIPPVLAQDASQQVNMTYTGISGDVTPAIAPALPANLMEPLILWERPSGTTNFREMHNKTAKGGLSKILQGEQLTEWEWRSDMICFRGALIATDVLISFTALPGVFVLDNTGHISGSLGDVDAMDVVAYKAAAQLLPQRGGAALAVQYETMAQNLVEQLATSTTRQEQFSPARMRAFRSGRRGRGFGRI